MPYPNPVVLAETRYSLRHIGPKATVAPNSPASTFSVLTRSDMVARPLYVAGGTRSPDFVQGAWTGRIGDAGEATATFPNAVASDGGLWRSRFDATNHLQWLEIYDNNELESVVVFDQVGPISQQSVQVHGFDGFWLTKKAYERDWICTLAPRDVIMRGCSLWMPVTVDSFTDPLLGNWTILRKSGTVAGEAIVRQSGLDANGNPLHGGVTLSMNSGSANPNMVAIESPTVTLPASTGVWQAFVSIPTEDLASGGSTPRVRLAITESTGDQYAVTVAYTSNGTITGTMVGNPFLSGSPLTQNIINASIPNASSYQLLLESDGLWVWAFVNGALVACIRRWHVAGTTSLQTEIALLQGPSGASTDATIGSVLVRAQTPWLQSASDPGDFVLPGDQTTYPWGGLQARYFNDADLRSDPDYLLKVLNPSRTQAYGGPSPNEYFDQQEHGSHSDKGVIAGQQNPQTGAGTNWWSAIWFGSIYLKMSAGGYQFQLQIPGSGAQVACRIWIGDTSPRNYAFSAGFSGLITGPQTYQFTVSQASLTGTLPYGQGSQARDGWYPIVIWYAVAGTSAVSPTLQFRSVPVAYQDPGGTSLSPSILTTVPKTSCSPLGCVDQRFQALAHFDLIQQIAQGWGYQFAVEPKQLEATDPQSGLSLFPGVLAPRIREGHDSDVVLMPDDDRSRDAEGVLNATNTQDATDFASSMYGNGAGQQTNNLSQVQSMVFDPATMRAALFDCQMWQDFSDAAYPELLRAFLNAQLSLQLEPWQLLTADPYGLPRLAFTWPLPGSVQAMRWRPGDGLQIRANVINLWDSLPRQMLVVQRSFVPEGITGTTATFVNRPKTEAHTIKQMLHRKTRWQRSYQRHHKTLSSNTVSNSTIPANSVDSNYCELSIVPGDRLAGLTLWVTVNNGTDSQLHDFGVYMNGTDVTTGAGLFGPWHSVPVAINLLPAYGQATSTGTYYVRVHLINETNTVTQYDYQLFAEVVR